MSADSDSKKQEKETIKKETPIPEAGISEILGLIELLKSKDGKADIYKLAAELQMEYGETLAVIRSAELLNLVHTPGGDVVLEKLGEKVSREKVNEKKDLIKIQIRKIPVFDQIVKFLGEQEGKQADKDEVMEKLAELVPHDDAENSFKNLVAWGRYAELFGYNDDTGAVFLDT